MAIKIFKETVAVRDVKLALVEGKAGRVLLAAVDDTGTPIPGGKLMVVSEKGFHVLNGCPETIGLPIDISGKVKMY